MGRFFQSLLAGTVLRLLDEWRHLSLDLIRIRLARWYVAGVAGARLAFLGYVGLIGTLLLALAGFVVFHFGLFLLLPFSAGVKGAILMGLGLVYMLVAFAVLRYATAQATWMRFSKADDFVRRATEKSP